MSMTKKDSVGRAGPGAVHVVLARVVLCSSNVTEERAMWRQTTSVPTAVEYYYVCLLYTSPSPRDGLLSRMPSSA